MSIYKKASGSESEPKSYMRAIQYVISFFYQIIYQNMKSIVSLPNNEDVGILFAALLARNFKVLKSPRECTRLPCRLESRHRDTTNATVLPVAASSCRQRVVITYMGGGKCLAIRHIAYGCRCVGSRGAEGAAANCCRCAVRDMSVVSH